MFEVYLAMLIIILIVGSIAIGLGLYAIHQKNKKNL